MPPKAKFTKERVAQAAVEIVRKEGASALTARALGKYLGSSVCPIFSLFSSMEEVRLAAVEEAQRVYEGYLEADISMGKYPPYKASGMAYIRFAKEEKELFKLLYMRDRTGESIAENREAVRPQLAAIMENLGLDEDRAYLFHLQMWIYVHGIATMLATSYLEWSTEFISDALTDVYQGLKHRFTGGGV